MLSGVQMWPAEEKGSVPQQEFRVKLRFPTFFLWGFGGEVFSI